MSRRPSLLFRRHRAQIAPKWVKTRRRPPVKHTHVALRVSEVRVRVRGGRGVHVCGLGVRLRDPLVAGVQPITGQKNSNSKSQKFAVAASPHVESEFRYESGMVELGLGDFPGVIIIVFGGLQFSVTAPSRIALIGGGSGDSGHDESGLA